MPKEQTAPGYNIGAGNKFNEAIGQILVNHSLCEWAIRSLFVRLLGAPTENSEALISSQAMKAPTMAKSILAILKINSEQLPEFLVERIVSAVSAYQTNTSHRNIVAHWNWMPTNEDDTFATLRNPMLPDSDQSDAAEKSYSLEKLKEIGLSFAQIATYLSSMSAMLSTQDLPDNVMKIALLRIDEILDEVKASMLSLPDLPHAAEEQP